MVSFPPVSPARPYTPPSPHPNVPHAQPISFLIDIAVPNIHNLAKTTTDKQNKYQELATEIRAMWKQKAAQMIPIVISYTGVIPKSVSQSLSRLNLH